MKTKIKTVILLFNLLFLINNTSFSQIRCETLFTPTDYAYAQNRTQIILSQLPQDSIISLPQINKTLSIAIHIVKDSIGEVNVDTVDIYAEINNTSDLFKPISLSFRVCSVDTIDNFQYDDLKFNSFTTVYEEQQIVNLFYVDSLINIYVVRSSIPTSIGKSHDNYIIVCKENLNTIPHLMGHVFGLLHTSGNGDHAELVDGSNCLTAGDFVCDTEADPEFDPVTSTLWYYEDNCELKSWPNPYPLKDTNDNWYKIPSYNYMSLYSNCWCQLTKFQYQIIAYEYYLHKTYLR